MTHPLAITTTGAAALPETGAAPFEPGLIESYRRLADVFHDVLSEQSLDSLLDRIAATVQALIPHDDLAIYEADEGARTLQAVFARGQYADEVMNDEPFEFGRGITGWAVERREPVLANRADLDPRVKFVTGTPPDPESLIAVPLIARGHTKGALNIYRVGLKEFTDEEFRLAVRFADAAALALDNAHIRAELERQAQTDPLTGLWNHRVFHESLRGELIRASVEHTSVALLMLDLDDFKRVNDVLGHAVGDAVLAELGRLLRESVRHGDSVYRIGGEEFAIVVPKADVEAATGLAQRVLGRVEAATFGEAGRVTVSMGVAVGPGDAANPRELVACAELAMMTAKAGGKHQVVLFGERSVERPDAPGEERDLTRSLAHLKMLHQFSSKLTRLIEVAEIGVTVADELRRLIDYHNCRVFVREGDDLVPIAFRGNVTMHSELRLDGFRTQVGIGITGHVAMTGEPYITGDAARSKIGHHIEGTDTIDESILAVPLRYGTRVIGVIVVSKLGRDQFDGADLRVLEVVAGHATIALVNAQLYEAQRREADIAKALLEFTREVSSAAVLDEMTGVVVTAAARLIGSPATALWICPADSERLECVALWDAGSGLGRPHEPSEIAADVAAAWATEAPRILGAAELASGGGRAVTATPAAAAAETFAVVPFDVGERPGLLVAALDTPEPVDDMRRSLLLGIAAQSRLALANALSFEKLERTFLATVEALANALEAKDEYTSSHARWISDAAVLVGETLGLDVVAVKRLELAALFHDIGKIGIPSEILLKSGPLTPEERAVMEIHPEIGERILAPIEQLRDVRPIVRACHEHFDGNGYPDGLAGERIPIEARIILVCDAFHAMTTTRPYREALSAIEARDRLRADAGADFDPEVVEAFLQVLDERGVRLIPE